MSACTGSPKPTMSAGGGRTSKKRMPRPRSCSRVTTQWPRTPDEPVTRSIMLRAGAPAPGEIARLDRGEHLRGADRAHADRIGAGAHLEVVIAEARAAVEVLVEDEIVRAARPVEEG